jgi:hypothetical protein
MFTYLKYDYSTGGYSLIKDFPTDNIFGGILVDIDIEVMILRGPYLRFRFATEEKYFCTVFSTFNVNCNRIGELFKPIIEEYFETEDSEILVFIIRSLLPILMIKELEQEHIDKFELPKLSTKSARK